MGNTVCRILLGLCLVHFGSTVAIAQENAKRQGNDSVAAVVELVRAGDWKSALRAAKELSSQQPKNASAAYVADLASDVLASHGPISLTKYDFPYSNPAALRALQSWAEGLLSKTPENANVIILRAMLHSPKADGNTSKLIEFFERARSLESKNDFVLVTLGSAYGAMQNYDLAIETLRAAIELKATSGAYTNLGVAYLKKGEQNQARTYFEESTKLDAHDSMAWFNLGSYYLEGNDLIEAKPALEKAVELAPRNVDARWNLGGVYFNSGNRSKAAAQLKEIIRIAPTSAMGQQAKQMLAQLGG